MNRLWTEFTLASGASFTLYETVCLVCMICLTNSSGFLNNFILFVLFDENVEDHSRTRNLRIHKQYLRSVVDADQQLILKNFTFQIGLPVCFEQLTLGFEAISPAVCTC